MLFSENQIDFIIFSYLISLLSGFLFPFLFCAYSLTFFELNLSLFLIYFSFWYLNTHMQIHTRKQNSICAHNDIIIPIYTE